MIKVKKRSQVRGERVLKGREREFLTFMLSRWLSSEYCKPRACHLGVFIVQFFSFFSFWKVYIEGVLAIVLYFGLPSKTQKISITFSPRKIENFCLRRLYNMCIVGPYIFHPPLPYYGYPRRFQFMTWG